MITRRGQAARFVAIIAGSSAVFSAGLLLPAPSQGEYEHAQQATVETVQHTPTPRAVYPVTIYEDGSARMSDGSTRPEDTYPWNCATMGNRRCGK